MAALKRLLMVVGSRMSGRMRLLAPPLRQTMAQERCRSTHFADRSEGCTCPCCQYTAIASSISSISNKKPNSRQHDKTCPRLRNRCVPVHCYCPKDMTSIYIPQTLFVAACTRSITVCGVDKRQAMHCTVCGLVFHTFST